VTRPDANAVAKILHELADRLKLDGANPHRARAYARAADNLALSPLPLDELVSEAA
jgi:DNA polymerase/3'-5' exonuclease PolX